MNSDFQRLNIEQTEDQVARICAWLNIADSIDGRYSTTKTERTAEQPEWKRGILSHHVSNPSKADRAEFPREVSEAAIERSRGKCQ